MLSFSLLSRLQRILLVSAAVVPEAGSTLDQFPNFATQSERSTVRSVTIEYGAIEEQQTMRSLTMMRGRNRTVYGNRPFPSYVSHVCGGCLRVFHLNSLPSPPLLTSPPLFVLRKVHFCGKTRLTEGPWLPCGECAKRHRHLQRKDMYTSSALHRRPHPDKHASGLCRLGAEARSRFGKCRRDGGDKRGAPGIREWDLNSARLC